MCYRVLRLPLSNKPALSRWHLSPLHRCFTFAAPMEGQLRVTYRRKINGLVGRLVSWPGFEPLTSWPTQARLLEAIDVWCCIFRISAWPECCVDEYRWTIHCSFFESRQNQQHHSFADRRRQYIKHGCSGCIKTYIKLHISCVLDSFFCCWSAVKQPDHSIHLLVNSRCLPRAFLDHLK